MYKYEDTTLYKIAICCSYLRELSLETLVYKIITFRQIYPTPVFLKLANKHENGHCLVHHDNKETEYSSRWLNDLFFTYKISTATYVKNLAGP